MNIVNPIKLYSEIFIPATTTLGQMTIIFGLKS